jgi:BirA family biotin operon repressor/biotin-[acetyl-CoA-carboxylase] ligase
VQYRRIQHDLVDSTNERAFAALALGSARHGDVHVARGQSAGRGRLGRRWHSANGKGLYLSLVLLPDPPPWNPAALTMAGGLAVLDALRAIAASEGAAGLRAARELRIKWPNDVVALGAKLAGVLVETRGLDPAAPHYVLGLGLNVLQADFPAELETERAVTSLVQLGLDVRIEVVEETLLGCLAQRLEQVEERSRTLSEDFLAATHLESRMVRAEFAERETTGELVELSFERGIALVTDKGTLVRAPLEFVRALTEIVA